MILKVLFLTLVSSSLTQSADNNDHLQQQQQQQQQQRSPRAPQGQIQYTRPDGLKVDWKQYSPSTTSDTRSRRGETGTGTHNFDQKQQHVIGNPAQPIAEHRPDYQPYSALPSHIKQLLVEAYSPQGPYVDPGAFFYQPSGNSHAVSSAVAPQNDNQGSPSLSKVPIDQSYFNSAVSFRSAGFAGQQNNHQVGTTSAKLGGIKYIDEEQGDRVYQRSTGELPYGSVLMPSQSQTKRQYQPYKQIQAPEMYNKNPPQSTSQHQRQYNVKMTSRPVPQSELYNRHQSQPQNQQQFDKPQPHFHYEQQNNQNNQYNSQSQLYNDDHRSTIKKPDSDYHFNMQNPIQTLLNYQAQLPYNVIANHILYRPKQIFIPKPLPESAKIARTYPTKIYFVKDNGQVYDDQEDNEKSKDKTY